MDWLGWGCASCSHVGGTSCQRCAQLQAADAALAARMGAAKGGEGHVAPAGCAQHARAQAGRAAAVSCSWSPPAMEYTRHGGPPIPAGEPCQWQVRGLPWAKLSPAGWVPVSPSSPHPWDVRGTGTDPATGRLEEGRRHLKPRGTGAPISKNKERVFICICFVSS